MVQTDILAILKKYRILIIVAALSLSYRLIISPQIRNYSATKQEIKNLETKLAKAISLLGEEEEVNSIYEGLSQLIPLQVSDTLDWEKMSRDIYATLTTIANKYNVKILNYRPGLEKTRSQKTKIETSTSPEKNKPLSGIERRSIKAIDMDVNLEAQLIDFVKFIYYLENSVQLMEIDEAVLNAGSKKEMTIRLRIKKIIF